MSDVIPFKAERELASSHDQPLDGGSDVLASAIYRAETLIDVGRRLRGPLAALQPKLQEIRAAIQSLDDPQAASLEKAADSLQEATTAAIEKLNDATAVLLRAHTALVRPTDG